MVHGESTGGKRSGKREGGPNLRSQSIRREQGQGKIQFFVQLTTSRTGKQSYQV